MNHIPIYLFRCLPGCLMHSRVTPTPQIRQDRFFREQRPLSHNVVYSGFNRRRSLSLTGRNSDRNSETNGDEFLYHGADKFCVKGTLRQEVFHSILEWRGLIFVEERRCKANEEGRSVCFRNAPPARLPGPILRL